jgi:hypothetical protein
MPEQANDACLVGTAGRVEGGTAGFGGVPLRKKKQKKKVNKNK